MSDIKRLNYFNGQFLVENDFNDEQAYHVAMRRRLNQAFLTWGVGDGLGLSTISNSKQVEIGAGIAVDILGREMVILTPRMVDLSTHAPNSDVYISIQYREIQDPADHYTTGGVDNYTRWTERPDLLTSTTEPFMDGFVIPLALVHLDGDGNVATTNTSIRPFAKVRIDSTTDLQVGSLTVSDDLSVGHTLRVGLNVGIGSLVDPTRMLKIGGSTGNLLWVGATSGSTANIELAGHVQLREYGGNTVAYFQARDDSSNRDIGLRIRTQKAGASAPTITEALTIDGNGNVGIRTTNPAGHQLDIASSQGSGGNSAIRALYPAGAALLNTEFAALAHRVGAWTALYAKQGSAVSAAYFDGNVITTGNISFGSAVRQMVNLWSTEYGIGVQSGTQYYRTASNFAWYRGGSHHNDALNAGAGGVAQMVITNGNVGIGTDTPGMSLEVTKPSYWGSPAIGGSNGAKFAYLHISTADHSLIWDNNSSMRFGAEPSRGAGYTEWMRVSPNASATLTVNGAISLPKTGDGNARFSNSTYSNESTFTANNLKLIMGATGGLIVTIPGAPAPPPFTYEFMIGHTATSFILGGGGTSFEKKFSVNQRGDLYCAGSKAGYVVDYFVNRVGDLLEQGDVVVISKSQSHFYSGSENSIPILEVDLTEKAQDGRVCGIVESVITEKELPFVELPAIAQNEPKKGKKKKEPEAKEYVHPLKQFAAEYTDDLDRTKVQDQQMGKMVTLGAFSHCKVDADIAPIETGDLLTTSPTKGHAQKMLDSSQAVGAIIGKALGSLKKGKGKIPVLVMLQ